MTDHATRPGGDHRDAFGRWIRQNPRKTVLIGMGILLVLALIRGFTGEDTASLMQRTSDATAYFALVRRPRRRTTTTTVATRRAWLS